MERKDSHKEGFRKGFTKSCGGILGLLDAASPENVHHSISGATAKVPCRIFRFTFIMSAKLPTRKSFQGNLHGRFMPRVSENPETVAMGLVGGRLY